MVPFESKYNPLPKTVIDGVSHEAWQGYNDILDELKAKNSKVIVIECYHGVDHEEIMTKLIKPLNPSLIICSDDYAFTADEIKNEVQNNITDDRVFGVMSFHRLEQFFHHDKIKVVQQQISKEQGVVVVFGVGASFITMGDILLYADMTRWEIQLRYREGKLANWRDNNTDEDILRRYKRGYFLEWRWMDEHKKSIFNRIGYYLDTTIPNAPKMVTMDSYNKALDQLSSQPFRLKPYFDPGVWGGQWMKKVCNLDPTRENYAWSFDGVPEENSLLVQYGDIVLETPAINLVFKRSIPLLGEKVFARYGAEFPIRFDFLDTMQGQNLSLQVHPTTEYAYKNFGIRYTQDESYYILDADEDAVVYLGLKENVTPKEFIDALNDAQENGTSFDDSLYINKIPAKKHDHFLIPAGTIHCSGKNSMVLEISATPYIFTFKLWDWERVGLDGKPRPIHINHGKEVINYSRDTKWVYENLVNRFEVLDSNSDRTIEKTGLHKLQDIITDRYTIISKEAIIDTVGSVNMLNLVDGESAIVESVDGSFPPLIVNYAETFIVPDSCKQYKISPYGDTSEIKIIRAYIRD